MRVLAIDASLRNCGVAVLEAAGGKQRALYFGVIHNPPALRSSSCLVAIREQLADLIREHEPECCALESVIYVQSYKTAIALGAARGAAILAAAERGLPIYEYAPAAHQTVDRRPRQRGQGPGGVHGARAPGSNGNTGAGCGGCARDWSDSFAIAGRGALGVPMGAQI